jgi:hypothetical protein
LLLCDGIDASRPRRSLALRRRHTAASDTDSARHGKESMKVHQITACLGTPPSVGYCHIQAQFGRIGLLS